MKVRTKFMIRLYLDDSLCVYPSARSHALETTTTTIANASDWLRFSPHQSNTNRMHFGWRGLWTYGWWISHRNSISVVTRRIKNLFMNWFPKNNRIGSSPRSQGASKVETNWRRTMMRRMMDHFVRSLSEFIQVACSGSSSRIITGGRVQCVGSPFQLLTEFRRWPPVLFGRAECIFWPIFTWNAYSKCFALAWNTIKKTLNSYQIMWFYWMLLLHAKCV